MFILEIVPRYEREEGFGSSDEDGVSYANGKLYQRRRGSTAKIYRPKIDNAAIDIYIKEAYEVFKIYAKYFPNAAWKVPSLHKQFIHKGELVAEAEIPALDSIQWLVNEEVTKRYYDVLFTSEYETSAPRGGYKPKNLREIDFAEELRTVITEALQEVL